MKDKMVGQQFGPYRIEKYLESGGMATVYQAVDTRNGMIVALKILLEMYQGNPQVMQRFKREAKIAFELRHPAIVPMLDFGDINGKLYMAMRFMLGGSLADHLTKDPRLPIERSLHWMHQIGSALDFAHSRGIIHRDIKPGNILLDETNNAYLGDFGIARIMEGTQLTMTAQAQPGTVHFMSPEQVSGGLHLTYHSDIYAMGVLAYLLLVGRFPFTGTSEPIILAAHLNAVTRPPSQVNPQLPPTVDRVIYRALEKDPTIRFQSVTEFIMALRGAMGNKLNTVVKINPAADNPISTTRGHTMVDAPGSNPMVRPPSSHPGVHPSSNIPMAPSQHPAPRSNSGRNAMWIVLVLLLIFIGGGIVLIALSGGDEDPTPAREVIDVNEAELDTEEGVEIPIEPTEVAAFVTPTEEPRATDNLTETASVPLTETQFAVMAQITIEYELTRLAADNLATEIALTQSGISQQAIEAELTRLAVMAATTEAAAWTNTPTNTATPTRTSTATNTLRPPTATPTRTLQPTARPTNTRRPPSPTPPIQCRGALVSRLEMGGEGRVTRFPNQANNLRDAASTSGEKIGEIPPGGEFRVTDGPVCNGGYAWYRVNYQGVIGWTAESGDGVYWLEPWEMDN